MSSDLFQENTPGKLYVPDSILVIEPTKLRDEEEILTALVDEVTKINIYDSLVQ
jgi:hypothetical protein